MTIVRSHKGKQINMSALVNANSKVIAAGNMKINARGDLLGKGGKIVKTKEQLAAEYYNNNPMAVEIGTAPINEPLEDMLSSKKNPSTSKTSPVVFSKTVSEENLGSVKNSQKKKTKAPTVTETSDASDKSKLDTLDVLETVSE